MSLSPKRKARIAAMGGRVTTVEEWLDLSAEEVAVIDMKIQLGQELRDLRQRKHLSQEEAAELLHTSQGRVSKMEKGRASLDQLTRSLFVLGQSKRGLARVLLK